MFVRFLHDKTGATAVEYGVIAGIISVALVTGATAIGSTLNAKFNLVGTTIGPGLDSNSTGGAGGGGGSNSSSF
ncbi:MAG: Flp family type IVb pilin [Oricola sp.]|nr:Flp family type IVb pilin [Oricola sp.]MCI5077795.1 Flp family type IVb pilin [Oricola sp.]